MGFGWKADALEQRPRAVRSRRPAAHPFEEIQVLLGRQLSVEREIGRHPPDAPGNVARPVAGPGLFTFEENLRGPAARTNQAREGPQEGRFPAAVRARDAEDGALRDLERQRPEDLPVPNERGKAVRDEAHGGGKDNRREAAVDPRRMRASVPEQGRGEGELRKVREMREENGGHAFRTPASHDRRGACSLPSKKSPLRVFLPLENFPRVVLWAWERPGGPAVPRGPRVGVAFLAATVRLSGGAVLTQRRRQPLLVDPATPVMAVVRVETVRGFKPALSEGQREAVVRAALDAARLPRVVAVQIDGDAAVSERPFFRALLADLRERLDPRLGLSFTALASWCAGDRWLEGRRASTRPCRCCFRWDGTGMRSAPAPRRADSRRNAGPPPASPRTSPWHPRPDASISFRRTPWTRNSFEREMSRISR